MIDFLNSKVTIFLQTAIIIFTGVLFWFAFIYYPKVTSDYQTGKILPKPTIFTPVVAQTDRFPIATKSYQITYDQKSQTYYAYINGNNLEEFVFNRDNAKLALKTALSTGSICPFNVIYVSTSKLQIPQKYLDNTDC